MKKKFSYILIVFCIVMSITMGGCDKEKKVKVPKYVFFMIGDGMGYAQEQMASYYLGASQDPDRMEVAKLSFMQFPISGNVQTYDLTSYCPDSASTGTAFASGNKTCSGEINVDSTGKNKFETITEWLKKQYDYKIGIVTSVNVNHATPAAFYAHQPSRHNYYQIGQELVDSGIDYFAGGAFLQSKGKDGKQKELTKLAKEKGYRIFSEPNTLCKDKCIVISDRVDARGAIPYEIDSNQNDYELCDYVKNGIECLDNKKGFFMMIEGGKIDWACHSNDASTCVQEVISFNKAVQEVLRFYLKHQEETLIIVTADHETGGLSIGSKGTNYDTHLEYLRKQKISADKFVSDFVHRYQKENTSFEDAMKDVKELFGLVEGKEKDCLSLSKEECDQLKQAYEISIKYGIRKQNNMTPEEYLLYGNNDPFTETILHILNDKAGIHFSSYAHTGVCTPLYATGVGAENFIGYRDNTDVHDRLVNLFTEEDKK